MSVPANIVSSSSVPALPGDVLEKVVIGQDLSCLKPIEKVQYLTGLCKSLGLNPLTKPFEIMKFNGKEVPYARKDCTEQLRKINLVSITKIESKMLDGGLYIVTAYASTPDGRQDSSTGAVSIAGLKGDVLGNALMKAETKAKRRVTLSICGLGLLDETEVDSIPGAKKYNFAQPAINEMSIEDNSLSMDLSNDIERIKSCSTLDELQSTYTEIYKFWIQTRDKEKIAEIIKAKDEVKGKIEVKEFNDDINNGVQNEAL